MNDIEIYCKKCNSPLKEETRVCDKCGSSERVIHIVIQDEVKLYDGIRLKSKRNKKQIYDFIDGHESSQSHIIVYKRRIIDKEKDYYFEQIEDIDGNIIHICEENLSEHIGHGQPKNRKDE